MDLGQLVIGLAGMLLGAICVIAILRSGKSSSLGYSRRARTKTS